ncbi:unnamed protein product [Menidia menidia]|uniref:(Atlantic silverside) hypothetical protein n=1 Tax=Menidia menidia TaxID=238744 RepID=A0A8S4BJB7_9TELE|nr:unnamed protein product [Menidia menidia]
MRQVCSRETTPSRNLQEAPWWKKWERTPASLPQIPTVSLFLTFGGWLHADPELWRGGTWSSLMQCTKNLQWAAHMRQWQGRVWAQAWDLWWRNRRRSGGWRVTFQQGRQQRLLKLIQEGISQNCRQSLVGQGRRRKWMRAGQHAEAQPNGAPFSLSGRYDILTGDSGEGESSGPVAVKAGPVEGSNMVTLVDGYGVESRPVELGLASPLSPTHSFLEAGSPSSVAYLQELGSYGPDGSLGGEAEGTVGETERG